VLAEQVPWIRLPLGEEQAVILYLAL
jgi:hypothetical protein